MYNLFIVDDEEIVRKGIRELLENADGQYTICGEAPDGELALPMIQELKPDILLTDIRMPFIDGLELCEIIRKKMPWVHILILSGHDEFEYARKAVSLGIDEYILKPVTLPQLLGSLGKTVQKIEEERAAYFSAHAGGLPSQDRLILVEHFLNSLLDTSMSAADAYPRAEQLGLSLSARKYAVCCMQFQESDVPRQQLRVLLGSLLEQRTDILWSARGERFVLLIKAQEAEAALEAAYETAQIVRHETERLLQTACSVGIGTVVSRIGELPESYRQAKRSLSALPGGSILSAADLDSGFIPRFDFSAAIPLAERLRHVSAEDLDNLLENHFGTVRDTDQSSLLYRYYLLADLVVSSMRLLRGLDAELPAPLRDAGDNAHLMEAVATYEGTLALARSLLEAFIEARDRKQGVRYGQELRRAKEYIREHYGDNALSLNTVAAEVGFSPNHFSTVFSQQMGQTFVEYLTRLRVEESKRLLRETDTRLADIAYAIGYSEPHYFSYIFKKYAGMSPSTYRKQARGES